MSKISMRRLLLPVAALISAHFSVAQTAPACFSDEVNKRLMQQYPSYAASVQQQKENWNKFVQLQSSERVINTGGSVQYEIPVVVHIVHTGGIVGSPYNPTDARIQSWIDYLNKCYAAQWPAYADTNHGGVYIPFKFVLAQRSPDCQSTTGIVRVNGSSLPGYSQHGVNYLYTGGVSDSAVKSLSVWSNTDYYNIWVVNKIDDGTSGIGAYATFPGTPANVDGALFPVAMVDTINAIAHELGHAFGLAHTFEGNNNGNSCPPNNNCNTDGDGVCDTEPHQYTGCVTGVNNCTGMNYAGVQYNFMDYSTCQDRFTAGQRTKAIYNLVTNRPGLVTSLGATPPASTPFSMTAAQCIPGIVNAGNAAGIGVTNVTLADLSASSGTYGGDNYQAYIDYTTKCVQPFTAHLTPGGTYPISVTTGTTNGEHVRVWIDYNNDGSFQSSEMVLDRSDTSVTLPHTGQFTLPVSATQHLPLRMRVMSDFNGSAAPSSCTDVDYGQTEDYAVIIGTPTGITTVSAASKLSVFPNPADDRLTIITKPENTVHIYNTLGQQIMIPIVKSADRIVADIRSLAPGYYHVICTGTSSTGVAAFIKK
ncbi:GEVED domain-containing protein [Chitinophagaceae bacterium MMS25-I14]